MFFFRNGAVGWITLEFCITYGWCFTQLLVKKNGRVRSRSYNMNKPRPFFFRLNRYFSNLLVNNWNRDNTRDLGQNVTSDLWHCHSTFRRSSGHWSWLIPYLPLVAILTFFGVSWGTETEYMAHFSQKPVYKGLLNVSDTNRGHCPNLPAGDFSGEGDIVPFGNVLRRIYSIK